MARQPRPERQARKDSKPGNDALCTECKTWYDSTNQGQVNKHAH